MVRVTAVAAARNMQISRAPDIPAVEPIRADAFGRQIRAKMHDEPSREWKGVVRALVHVGVVDTQCSGASSQRFSETVVVMFCGIGRDLDI
ncbi:hypothetical protein E2P81_ATG07296 [Venturia nashicola]|nr:hypothetical protein E2P81_ATG07296 [Venturia nashicola]